jgi:hypothetical protein
MNANGRLINMRNGCNMSCQERPQNLRVPRVGVKNSYKSFLDTAKPSMSTGNVVTGFYTEISAFCLHALFMYSVRVIQKTTVVSLQSVNWPEFQMEPPRILSAQ